MKRMTAVLTALMLLLCSACAGNKDAAPASEAPQAPAAPADFEGYVSNTVIATGANYLVDKADSTTFRTYLPVEEAGSLSYSFYISNVVDSTWERGRYAYVGKDGGAWTIESAGVGTAADPEGEVSFTPVTFAGKERREVSPGQCFWSDEVTLDVPEGQYLVWEWTLTGQDIPCIRMSELAYSYAGKDGALDYNMDVPAPKFIGAKRSVTKTVACFGDSITQGAQTSAYGQGFWAAGLSRALGPDVSVYNAGIGYARASDAAQSSDWRARAGHANVVTLAFGTNDLAVGAYGQMGGSSAEEIEGSLRTLIGDLQEGGCTVILFNAPPFDFDEGTEEIRQALNARIPVIAEETGALFFDMNAVLEDPAHPGTSLYGGHPDDEGCALVTEALLAQYGDVLR
ncbi:MAG: SGNH/GDSL hydrolase family protein [Oscillospiraceae bacterium]|nr:SGNH/GDSL hydrolase family protein [Oscillospiraceae bacterium]